MRYPLLTLALLLAAACSSRGGGRGDALPGDAATTHDGATTDGAVHFDAGPYDSGHLDSGRFSDLGPRPDLGPPPGGCLPHTCPDGQVCADGLCSVAPDPTFFCGTNPFSSDDMCGADGVCIGDVVVDGTLVSDRLCYRFGACDASGRCPVSTNGAICNVMGSTMLIGGKGAICMASFCRTVADCPSGQLCIYAMAGGTSGAAYCSDGSLGSLCNWDSDCASGRCMGITPGARGSCIM